MRWRKKKHKERPLHVTVVDLGTDDILLVSVDAPMSVEEQENLKARISSTIRHRDAHVYPGTRMKVVGPDEEVR
jgi:hypothetical protein